MKHSKVLTNDGKGYYEIFESSDFEYVNPLEYYADFFIQHRMSVEKDILILKKLPFSTSSIQEFLFNRATDAWNDMYLIISNTEIPTNLLSVLGTNKKKNQIKFLKGLSINSFQLLGFIFKACSVNGFSYSQYKVKHHHKGVNPSDLPIIIDTSNEKIEHIGNTKLTDSELKQVVDHRKVVVAKFLDKGEEWHCLYTTFKSLRGDEKNWKNGQPHLHYISSSFGISRKDVLESLRSNKYQLPSTPHIDLIDYGNKPVGV